MNLNIYNLLVIMGTLQGFIFSGVVFSLKKYKSRSNYYLALLILVFSLSNLQYFISDSGILSMADMYSYIFMPWGLLIPVLIYFYTELFMFPEKKFSFKEKLLFVPFFIILISTLVFRIGRILNFNNQGFEAFFATLLNAQEILAVIITIAVLIVLYNRVKIYKSKFNTFKLDIVTPNLNWLKLAMIIWFVLTIIWTYLVYKNIFLPEKTTSFYLLWIGMSVAIYFFGHVGIYKYGIIDERKKIRASKIIKHRNDTFISKGKSDHIKALEQLLIEDKIFLDSNLTSEIVAKKLNISTGHLSRIIKTELHTNFNDYLNLFRINEAKTYLENSEFSNYTITAIGLEAGFNSKSTFYAVFKKATGQTPLAYKKASFKTA